MRYLPLNKDLKPLIPYKSQPELGFSNGIEYGEWAEEAVQEGYGVGLLLDNSGLVVIDTDSSLEFGRRSTAKFGWAVFKELCKSLGLDGIPHTFTVRTRTPDHYHFYFYQHPDYPIERTLIHSKIPDCDVKVTGFVVSHYTEGYDVVRQSVIQELPEVLGEYLHSTQVHSASAGTRGERAMSDDHAEYLLSKITTAGDGERNRTLHRGACAFRDSGRTSSQHRNSLLQAAVMCGLHETEAIRTIESAWK